MKPVVKNILFKPLPSDETTEGGLFIPESVREVNNKGTIIDIGSRVTKVKVGDTAFRVKNWGEPIIINGETHYLMNEDAVIALQ